MGAITLVSVIIWLAIPPVLSRAMKRRGYDGLFSMILGGLYGPVAVVFAVIDILFEVAEPPGVVQTGQTGEGDLSVLVVVGGDAMTSPPMAALAGLGLRLPHLALAKVPPRGGPERRSGRPSAAFARRRAPCPIPSLCCCSGGPTWRFPTTPSPAGTTSP